MNDSNLEKKPLKRVVTFDFIRGCAIIGVLGFHLLAVTYDYNSRFDMGIENLPIAYIILVLILAFMGSLFPAFVLISAVVNTISMDKKWKKLTIDNTKESRNMAFKKILKMQMIRGFFLIIFDKFIELFLNGFLTKILIPETTEEIISKFYSELYHQQIIGLIGWGVILTSLLYLTMKKKEKSKKKIIISLIIIGSLFIVLSPLVNYLFELVPGLKGYPNRSLDERNFFVNLLYFFLSPIVNGWYPLFPDVSIFFLGMILGLEFSDGNYSKKFMNKIIISSLGFLLLGLVIFFAFEEETYTKYLNDMLIPTSGSLLLLVILVYFIEIKGNGTRWAKKTIFFRRFGNLSLTIWGLQWLMMIFLRVVHLIFYGTSIAFINGDIYNSLLSGWATWGLFFTVMPLWWLLLILWEKFNYKGTLEYWFARLSSKDKNIQSAKSDIENSLKNIISVISEEEGQKYYKPLEITGMFFLVLLNIVGTTIILLF